MYWYYIQESSKKITEKKKVRSNPKTKEFVMIKVIKTKTV